MRNEQKRSRKSSQKKFAKLITEYKKPMAYLVMLFVVGFLLFKSNNKIQEVNADIIEIETINEFLMMQLEVEKMAIDSLSNIIIDLSRSRINPHVVRAEIKQRYYEKTDSINALTFHEQYLIFTRWIAKKDSIRGR